MIKIAICDDEIRIQNMLKGYIDRYSKEKSVSIDVVCFDEGKKLLESYSFDCTIILLDIKLDDENGIHIAQKIREIDPEVCIIFVTSFSQFAIKGYSVRAFGFLTKPLEYDVFCRELSAALKVVSLNDRQCILVKDRSNRKLVNIDITKVIYFEVKEHDLMIISKTENISIRESISRMEKLVSKYGFIRCHASFLINYRYVQNIDQFSVTMTNGDVIPISRNRKQLFMDEITTWIGRTI